MNVLFIKNKVCFYLRFIILFCLLVVFAACLKTSKSNSVVWKSVDLYNNSNKRITVTSLQGIQAYAKKRGPQDLRAGKLVPKGRKSSNTMREMKITYPVVIRWMDGLVKGSLAKGYDEKYPKTGPNVYQQTINKFCGLPSDVVVIKEEASLLLVFTGFEWEAYYVSGDSGLREDSILKVVESAKRDH